MLKHLVSLAVGCAIFLAGCGTAKAYAAPATKADVIEARDAAASPEPLVLGAIDGMSVMFLMSEMDDAKKAGAKSLTIKINSPGGSVFAGFALSQKIEELGIPVHCAVDGAVASMAVYVLESCATRTMTKRSFMMLHGPAVSGADGDETDLRNTAEFLRVLESAYVNHIAGRAGPFIGTATADLLCHSHVHRAVQTRTSCAR